MRPLKRLQIQHGSRHIAEKKCYDQLRTENHSPSFKLPKIQCSLPSIRIPHQDSLAKLEHYVHRLIEQQQQDVLRLRRQKRAKKEEQARREYQKQRESLEKEKERLYMEYLQEQLKWLKREQRAEESRLAQELTRLKNYHLTDYKSSIIKGIQGDFQPEKELISERLKQDANTQKQKKQKKINLKRKFRIVVFAVYFALAFKKYASVFKQVRKKYFHQQVFQGKILQKQTKDFVTALRSIKFDRYSQIQKKQNLSSEAFTFTEIDQKGQEYQMEISFLGITKRVLEVLRSVRQMVKGENLNKLLQALSFYFTRRSFLCDSVFLLDELYRLHLNPGQQELVMGEEMQTCLLLNYIISKVVCFKFMLTPIEAQNSSKKRQRSRRQKTLLMGGLYLFSKCNQVTSSLVNDSILKSEGNLEQLDKVRFPKAMQPLQISEDYNFDLGSTKEKRTSIEENIKFSYLNNYGIKYKDMEKAEEFVRIIVERTQIETEVSELLSEIALLIRNKSFQSRKKHLEQICQATIGYKHYLTHEIQVAEILVKRLPSQIKANEQNISLFRQARAQTRKQSMKQMSLKALKSAKQNQSSRQNLYMGLSSATASQKQSEKIQSGKLSEKVQLTDSLQNRVRSSIASNISQQKATTSHQYLSVDKQNVVKKRKSGQGGKLKMQLNKKKTGRN